MRSVLKKAAPDLELQIEKLAVVPPPSVTTPISMMGLERRKHFIEAHHSGGMPSVDRQLSMQSMTGSYSASASVSSVVLAASMDAIIQGYPDPSPPSDIHQVQHRFTVAGLREDKASKNPMLASLLDQDNNSPETQPPPSMLSQLLNNEGMPGQGKQKKPRKRKSMSDVRSPGSSGRSPKRKPNDDDFGAVREFSSMDMDLNSHGSNSYDMSAVLSQEHQHINLQRPQPQVVYGNSGMHESHVSRLASSVDNIIKQESKNFSSVPHQAGLEMPQPPPYIHPPMAFANEIKQEHPASMEAPGITVKREGSHAQSATSKMSKGNSLADLLKTDSPTSEPETMLAPPPVTAPSSLPKKEFAILSQPVNDRSVGYGTKNHKSFDSAVTNANSKSHDFKRSNSVEILDSPPAKVKIEGGKSVNIVATKNSIGREKTKFASDSRLDIKHEDKQGTVVSVKDKVKKEKREDDPAPRLTLKIKRDVSSSKDLTQGVETPPLQDPFDHAKAITPKDLSKLTFKEKFSGKDHIYDLGSDPEEAEPLPPLGHARTAALSSESSKPSSPAGKIRKIKSEDAAKFNKKIKSTNKYDADHPKKKRKDRESDGKKDKIKKRKIYDIESEFNTSSGDPSSKSASSSPNLMSGKPLENKPSTTIRISTVAGKLQITPKPNSSPLAHVKSSSKTSSTTQNPQVSKPMKTASSASKINRPPGSSKQFNRSKSDPHGTGTNRMDTKLTTKTPTIKLKPLVMPSSTTTVTVNTSNSKVSQSTGGSTPNQSGSKSASSEKTLSKSSTKPSFQKPRKSSLSAVIDTLTKKQHGSSTLSQKLEKIEKRSTGKGDALSTKNKQDAIRQEILKAAMAPSKDLKSSQRKSDSARVPSEPGFTRLEKSGKLDFSSSGTPASLPSTPIPKISKTTGASPSGLPSIPKISNSASKSSTGSSAPSKFSASSVLARSASNMSSTQSSETAKSSGGSKEASYSSKGPSATLGGNEAGKSKTGPSPVGGGSVNQASLDAIRKESQSSFRKSDQIVRHNDKPRDNHSPSLTTYNSQNPHNSTKDLTNNEDGAKKIKLDDSGDRSQGRHFLDALGSASSHGNKGENSGKSEANNKESYKPGMKRPVSASSASENSKSEQYHHSSGSSGDRSRLNGLNAPSGSSSSRSSPKEGINRSEKTSIKEHSAKTSDSAASSSATDKSSTKSVTVNNKQVNNVDYNHRSARPYYNQSPVAGNSNNAAKSTSQTSHISATSSNSKLINSHSETSSSNDPSQIASVPAVKQDSVGTFDNKENTGIASPDPEDSVFKAPTPKTSRRDEPEMSESRSSRLDKIKPIRSPCSNPSSPEDSLVIDCPGTPSSKSSRSPGSRSTDRSPVTVVNRSPVCPNSGGSEIRSKSPATGVISNKLPPPQSPSTRKPLLTNKLPPPASPSPPKSPMMQHNSPAAPSRQSPVEIDDDLMDEAITL